MVTTKPARRDPARDLSAPRHQALGSLLGRVWAVDQVGVEERAASLAKRSIKREAKLWALDLAIRMMDLTTLEGKDTPGKIRALAGKARRPDPTDPSIPSVAALCVYPTMVPEARAALAGLRRQGRGGRHLLPQRAGAAGGEARRRAGRQAAGRRRDRHGHRPRRVPGRRVRPRLRRDRGGQGGLRRDAPEGDPGDRRARDLRQRAPRLGARHGGRRRLHQDLHRQGPAGIHPAGHAGHAGGDPRLLPADRAARWA